MGDDFSCVERDGVAVVLPPVELDLSNADRLRGFCQHVIETVSSSIVVDLSRTTFMDSTALGVLVGVAKQVKRDDGWLLLAPGASAVVQRLLKIAALDTRLGSYATVDDAIAAGRQAHPRVAPASGSPDRI
jgi:anti-sigma B factor antagonist